MGIPSQPTTVISLGPRSGQPNSNRSLATEFGDTSPHNINDFYRGGPLVANHPVNSGVPTTIGGTRSLSQYNGASIVHRYTISSPVQNLNLYNYATSASRTGTTKSQGYIDNGQYTAGEPGAIEFTINPGVVIGSATRTQNALETGVDNPTSGGWHPSVIITVINQGQIIGAGGNGGGVGPTANWPQGQSGDGFSGGTAILASRPVTIQNAGTVAGGGGGGGAGDSIYDPSPDGVKGSTVIIYERAGGGGGGGGAGSNTPPNTGGAGGVLPSILYNSPYPGTLPQPGLAGTLTTGGQGRQGIISAPPLVFHPYRGGTGGTGGALGAAGTAGGAVQFPVPHRPLVVWPPYGAGGGGAAGFYAVNNPLITWQQTGTRQGQVG